jgi:hypothetical protein
MMCAKKKQKTHDENKRKDSLRERLDGNVARPQGGGRDCIKMAKKAPPLKFPNSSDSKKFLKGDGDVFEVTPPIRADAYREPSDLGLTLMVLELMPETCL